MKLSKVPKYHEFHWPVIKVLQRIGGSASIEELLDLVIEEIKIPETIMAIPHGDGPRSEVEYRLAWSRTYLKKAGALENSSRGVWSLTEKGRSFKEADAVAVTKQVQRESYKNRRSTEPADGTDIDQNGVPELIWQDALLLALKSISPSGFERLCRRVLLESGFTRVEVTGQSGDGGIDGVGVLRVNLVSFHVLFQCKRWNSGVGSETVRNFRGAMQGRADKGLIITTGTFTSEAKKEATRDGAPAIDLVDGEALCLLLKNLKLGVDVRLVEDVHIDEAFFQSI